MPKARFTGQAICRFLLQLKPFVANVQQMHKSNIAKLTNTLPLQTNGGVHESQSGRSCRQYNLPQP